MDDSGNRTDAARAYYSLVVAALVLPVLVLLAGGWVAWQYTLQNANAELRRALAASAENMTTSLDTHLLVAGRVGDLLSGMDDAAVAANATELRDRIRTMLRRFPQVSAVTVTDRDGHPLLSTSDYPVVAGTAYLRMLHDPQLPFFVGAVRANGLTGQSDFAVGTRWGQDTQHLQGGVLVAESLDYFDDQERAVLASADGRSASLRLPDGTALARFPPPGADADQVPLPGALGDDPAAGTIRLRSPVGGSEWLFAYRKLDDYPVYASVARSSSSIVGEWRAQMSTHLIFGIPATLGLVALSLAAARRAQRESVALTALREEVRRRELAEDALRQAQKMDAVGRLTSGIAHDFNNHLTVINSNVELMKRRLPENARALTPLADAAMQGVQRAATLTHRLLAFSRQQPLEPEPLDMGRLVAGMTDLLRTTLGETVVVETTAAGGLWLTRLDANQMESAVLHLAVNARDAMPGGGRLTIRVANVHLDDDYATRHADASAGDFVMLSVADTGSGMSPEVAAKAFEPFFTTKPMGKGTGLGLSMIYGFVRQSGGHVAIASSPGHGATVTLYLPRYVPAAAKTTARDMPPVVVPGHRDAGETVLVVEDDDAMRRSAVEALHDIGYQVLEAPDAMEAIRVIADRGGIDLLFTDVGLPGGVDGRALADAARTASPTIRILFTTGYSRHTVQDACSDSAGVHFLAKPFTLVELGAKVREVLDAPVSERVGAGEVG